MCCVLRQALLSLPVNKNFVKPSECFNFKWELSMENAKVFCTLLQHFVHSWNTSLLLFMLVVDGALNHARSVGPDLPILNLIISFVPPVKKALFDMSCFSSSVDSNVKRTTRWQKDKEPLSIKSLYYLIWENFICSTVVVRLEKIWSQLVIHFQNMQWHGATVLGRTVSVCVHLAQSAFKRTQTVLSFTRYSIYLISAASDLTLYTISDLR